jgi:hypothetical protein
VHRRNGLTFLVQEFTEVTTMRMDCLRPGLLILVSFAVISPLPATAQPAQKHPACNAEVHWTKNGPTSLRSRGVETLRRSDTGRRLLMFRTRPEAHRTRSPSSHAAHSTSPCCEDGRGPRAVLLYANAFTHVSPASEPFCLQHLPDISLRVLGFHD